jgi:predicted glycosyltransferase
MPVEPSSCASLEEGDPRRRLRIAIYASATSGLGHLRRSLRVAEALRSSPRDPSILLLAGAREAGAFRMPTGIDCLALPSLCKQCDGGYRAAHLDLPAAELVRLRSQTIDAALEAFAPDVLIVDLMARGALGELEPALSNLRASRGTHCILGLRDVLDEPELVRREWCAMANEEAIHRWYDAVWVYGDQRVYDVTREYGFPPSIAAKIHYAGYLERLRRGAAADLELLPNLPPAVLPRGRFALCLVGGGRDGAQVAEAFVGAELPNGGEGVIVTGPFMPPDCQERLLRRTAENPRLRLFRFIDGVDCLLELADRVVAMGGYNTVCEVLSAEKPALIVPRVAPRREQAVRAERLRALGLIDVLAPEELNPRALARWLASDLPCRPAARDLLDLDGARRLPRLLEELLSARAAEESSALGAVAG